VLALEPSDIQSGLVRGTANPGLRLIDQTVNRIAELSVQLYTIWFLQEVLPLKRPGKRLNLGCPFDVMGLTIPVADFYERVSTRRQSMPQHAVVAFTRLVGAATESQRLSSPSLRQLNAQVPDFVANVFVQLRQECDELLDCLISHRDAPVVRYPIEEVHCGVNHRRVSSESAHVPLKIGSLMPYA
jgi:hypothetical protein